MSRKREIIIPKNGDVFEKWTFISEHKINERIMWKCKCVCGTIKIVKPRHIIIGSSKGCGCGEKLHLRKGFGQISGTYWCNIKCGANSRNLDFNITIEDAWHKFLEQKSKCALTGFLLEFGSKDKLLTPSLDRIDSDKGYIHGNIQWVSSKVNIMKWKINQEDFLFLIKKICENNNAKKNNR